MTKLRFGVLFLPILTWVFALSSADGGEEAKAFLAQIKAVGPEGAGNAEAGKAWEKLVALGPVALSETLVALDNANPIAANWLRLAVEAIAEKEIKEGRKLPADRLEKFVREMGHAGSARDLAFEWLSRIEPTAPDRLLPGMLDDPGSELRRQAVARAMQEVQKVTPEKEKKARLEKLFTSARDRDQVDQLAADLKKLGVTVDVRGHYGFIDKWMLIGPFDNTAGKGFHQVYPPEKQDQPGEKVEGKKGAQLQWVAHVTTDTYGLVDLNKALSKNMGAVAYARTQVESPREHPVQIRMGSNNAVKIFLNGKLLFFRDEYHHGMRMDQHVGSGVLRAGKNNVLIKVCQNEQTEPWAQTWSFQLRICDELGGGVPLTISTAKLVLTSHGEDQK